jgi:surface protein
MENMFKNCYNLNEIELTMFDISNVKNIKNIFEHCPNLKTIKVDEQFKNDFYNIINNENINFI